MTVESEEYVQPWADGSCPGWVDENYCCIRDMLFLKPTDQLPPILIKINHPILDTFQLKMKSKPIWNSPQHPVRCNQQECEMSWNDGTEEEWNVTIYHFIKLYYCRQIGGGRRH